MNEQTFSLQPFPSKKSGSSATFIAEIKMSIK